MVFFAHGYEHAIVNFFVIPAGIFFDAEVSLFHWWMWNQVPVLLGNFVGGACLTGLPLAMIWPVPKDAPAAAPPSPSPVWDSQLPAMIVKAATDAGVAKTKLPIFQMVLRGSLSGLILGIATSLAILIWCQPFGKEFPFLGALAFPVGFCMLVLLGLELVTGNFALIPMAVFAGKADVPGMLKNFTFVTLGNIYGAVLYAILFWACYSWLGETLEHSMGLKAAAIATAKTVKYEDDGVLGWFTALIKAICCNWMVTMGVIMSFTSKSTIGRIAAMWMPIMIFFAHGYEHAVVNFFVIPAGILFDADVTFVQWWWWNQVPVLIGNLIGGVCLTAIPLAMCYPVSALPATPAPTGAAALAPVPEASEEQNQIVDRYMDELKAKSANGATDANDEVLKYMAFKDTYNTKFVARLDVNQGELIRVTEYLRLTPEDYDRHCFHVELDVAGTSMDGEALNGSQGKALSVYSQNDAMRVRAFLSAVRLDGQAIIKLDDLSTIGLTGLTTVEKLFINYLDIFGQPSREFLKQLLPFAKDIYEKTAIAELTLDRNLKQFQDNTDKALTFADYITMYPSLSIPAEKYLEVIPTIKQRVYSICSSTRFRPGKCQLLVVVNDWQASDGQTKFGLCSDFLSKTRGDQFVLCHPTHSVMQMPSDHSVHVIMVGLGTGLAPFRAFIEERKFAKSKGKKVGKMTLFFGGRYSKNEYYYRDEMDAYEAEGLLQCFHAWSRDTDKKVYVQHKIQERSADIWEELGADKSKGHFYLCGPKQPEKDVNNALLSIFQTVGGLTAEQAQSRMDALKESQRYVTEVY